MLLRRFLPIIVLLLALPLYGFAQDKGGKTVEKTVEKTDPAKVMQESQLRKQTEAVKAVPITNKTMDAIRMQNRKATMEQMHTINKAIRKSMTVRKRK